MSSSLLLAGICIFKRILALSMGSCSFKGCTACIHNLAIYDFCFRMQQLKYTQDLKHQECQATMVSIFCRIWHEGRLVVCLQTLCHFVCCAGKGAALSNYTTCL